MDGSIVFGLIGSSATIISVVGGTAWLLANKISDQGKELSGKISRQGEEITGMSSEIRGMRDTYQAVREGCRQVMDAHDARINRLEDAENGKRK